MNDFVRLKRGLQAFFKGMEERDAGDRMHQIVRSIEAVVYPPPGKTRNIFSSRCALLAGGRGLTKTDFEEIYDLRSCIVHLHELESYEKLQPGIRELPAREKEQYFLKRLRQVEGFSRLLYKKNNSFERVVCIF